MSSKRRNYLITFGIEKNVEGEQNNKINEIPEKNLEIEGEFDFYDFNRNSTIGYLKEFFLTTFGQKYKYCKCVLYLFYQEASTFKQTKYKLLSDSDEKKLRDFPYEKLFLIKRNTECNCEFKMYTNYMNMKKFDIIAELKDLNEINSQLQKEIEKLKKYDELKKTNKLKPEEFYDIVIDINSIKSVNTEGWKVIFNESGKEKYISHKNEKEQKAIILGVLGNNNKGKSFLLSKISKLDLPTGTSIETKGLSVKYPELKGFKERQLILLDSAGLETPVLIKENKEIIKKEDDKEKNDEIKNEHEIIEELNQNQDDKEHIQNKKIDENSEEIIQIELKKEILNKKEIEQNKEFKENARDKIMTELFLQNFIIMVSDILLIVVGKLTYSEQLLINKIKVESKKQNKGRIFIIHNLQEFRAVEQVQDYIKNTLLKCSTFNLKKRTWISTNQDKEIKKENINQIHDIPVKPNIQINQKDDNEIKIELKNNDQDKDNNVINKINDKNVNDDDQLIDIHFTEILNYGDKKKLEVYHLILANEDSEAGDTYNKYTFEFIENLYNLIPEPKKFDIFEQVKDNFKKLSSTILNDDIEKNEFNKDIIEDKKIILEKKENLTLKKCYTDELGFSFFKTGDFEPKYNYFKPDENTLEIRLEVPGKNECITSHKIIGDETVVTVKGKKIKDNQPKAPIYNLFNIREFSDFELNIPLKAEDFKISQSEPKKGYPKFNNGICIIQYELAPKVKEVKASPEGTEDL